jgi:hemerythrin-like domain-containing protein
LREHHDRVLEALQLLYKALEARDAEALYKLVKFAQGFVDACHHSVEEFYLAWRSGDEKAFAELLDAARLYADHVAQHINKENGVLFSMLEANIHEVESGKTVEEVERENRHEEWLKTLEEVKRRLGA